MNIGASSSKFISFQSFDTQTKYYDQNLILLDKNELIQIILQYQNRTSQMNQCKCVEKSSLLEKRLKKYANKYQRLLVVLKDIKNKLCSQKRDSPKNSVGRPAKKSDGEFSHPNLIVKKEINTTFKSPNDFCVKPKKRGRPPKKDEIVPVNNDEKETEKPCASIKPSATPILFSVDFTTPSFIMTSSNDVKFPKPQLTLSNFGSGNIRLTWSHSWQGYNQKHLKHYELSLVADKNDNVGDDEDCKEPKVAKILGQINPLPLPMACTLKDLPYSIENYNFIIRCIGFKDGQMGPWSNYCSYRSPI